MSAMSHAQIIDQRQLIAVNLLKRWDGSVKSDSAAAGIYESFVHTLAHRLFSEKLGISLALEYMQRWPAWPLVVESFLSHKPSSTFILTTFAASVKGLQLRLEDDNPKNWLWEKLHPAIFTHNISTIFPWLNAILNVGPIGIGGDGDTIDASATADNAISDELPSLSGTTMRLLIDMADADKFYQSLSLGQSGQSLSPAAHDQLQAWLHVDPLPLAFSHEQLDKQCQHVLILTRE